MAVHIRLACHPGHPTQNTLMPCNQSFKLNIAHLVAVHVRLARHLARGPDDHPRVGQGLDALCTDQGQQTALRLGMAAGLQIGLSGLQVNHGPAKPVWKPASNRVD